MARLPGARPLNLIKKWPQLLEPNVGPSLSLCAYWGGRNLDPQLGHVLWAPIAPTGHNFFDAALAFCMKCGMFSYGLAGPSSRHSC